MPMDLSSRCMGNVLQFFLTYSQPGPSYFNIFVQYSQSDLQPLRPLLLRGPGPRIEPGPG